MSKFDVDSFLKERREKERLKKNNIKANDSRRTFDADKFLHERTIGFDTFSDDLNAMNTTLSGIYGGWQDADTMAKTRDSVSSFYDRLSAYEDYRKNYGTEEDELPDLSELMGFYKTSLDDWDNMTTTYGQYKSADEFNKAVKALQKAEDKKVAAAASKKEADEKKTSYIASDYIPNSSYGMTKAEYNRRRQANPDMPEFGSYDYFVEREKALKPMVDEIARDADRNDPTFRAWADNYAKDNTWGEGKPVQQQAKSLYEKFNRQDAILAEYNAIHEQLTKFESKGVHYTDSLEVDTESGAKEAQYAQDRLDTLLFATPLTNEEAVLGFYGELPEDKQANYDHIRDIAGQSGMEASKESAYKYFEKNKDKEYTDSFVGRVLGNAKIGRIGIKSNSAGFTSYSASSDDIEASEVYQILSERIQSRNAETFQNNNGFESTVATVSQYIPQGIDQFVYGTVGKLAGNAVGSATASSMYMYEQTAGASFVRLLQETDLSVEDAKALARSESLASSAVEFGLGLVTGGLWSGGVSLTKGATSEIGENLIKKMTSVGISERGARIILNTATTAGKLAFEGASEGLEEGWQEGIAITTDKYAESGKKPSAFNLLTKSLDYGQYSPEERAQIKEAFKGGATIGGFMGVGNAVVSSAQNRLSPDTRLGRAIRNNDNIGNILDMASTPFSPEEASAYEAYKEYAESGMTASNAYDREVGELARNLERDLISIIKSEKTSADQKSQAMKKLQDLDAYIEGTKVSDFSSDVKDAYKDKDSVKALIQSGLEGDKDSESYKLAKEYRAKLIGGKKLSDKEISKLSDLIAKEEMTETANEVKERLTELGEIENIDKIAEAISKRAMGRKLTSAENALIENSEHGSEVAREFISDLVLAKDEFTKISSDNIRSDALTNEMRLEARSGENNANAELMEYADGVDEEDRQLFIDTYDGKMPLDEYAKAFILVNDFAKENAEGRDTQDILLKNSAGLTPAQVGKIYKTAVVAPRLIQQKAIDRLADARKGKLTYKANIDDSAIDYDNKGTAGKVNWNSLTSRQRNAITFVKGFAKGMGINLKFVIDGAKEGYNGKYVAEENTIYIDVHAGVENIGGVFTRDTIIGTTSHEVTHWAKKKAPALYAELSNKIFSALSAKRGLTEFEIVAEEQKRLKGKYGKEFSAEYARDEIIARACEDMLSMSEKGKKMFSSLSEAEQKSLVAKIKEVVKDILKWIDDLLSLYKSNSGEASILRGMQDELQDIAKAWDAMIVSAREANAAMEAEVAETKSAYPSEQLSERNVESISQRDIDELRSIGRKSINEFTSEDIKKAEPFARRMFKELGVKSPFFRAWFGDWRVNDTTAVKYVSVNVKFIENRELIPRGNFMNYDTNWNIKSTSDGIDETAAKRTKHSDEYHSLKSVDNMISNAVLLDTVVVTNPSKRMGKNAIFVHHLYCPIIVGNKRAIAKLYVTEDIFDAKRFYLTKIEKVSADVGLNSKETVPDAESISTDTTISIAEIFDFVKMHDKDYEVDSKYPVYFSPKEPSKIVNADGTPKIMYHGSTASFTVFDKKKAKSSGAYGKGFYFTDSDSHAKHYGNTYAVYLDVKNPLKQGENTVNTNQIKAFLEAVAENEDYSIENYGTYDVSEIMKKIESRDAFAVIQDINATAIGDMVEAVKLWNEVNGTKFDGIVVPTETVVFESTQIKSATDNIGTFDRGNEDIQFSERDNDGYARIYEMQTEINQLDEKIRNMQNGEDFKSAMSEMSKAIDNGDTEKGIAVYNKWLEDSGYNEVKKKRDSLQSELDKLKKEWESAYEAEQSDEEQKAIEKSGLSEADYFRKQAVKEFGYTPFFYDAGYIVPNGKMLNFSGEKGAHYGSRGQDHRAIGIIYANTEGSKAMVRFMGEGNIRIMPESPGVDISSAVAPTKEQYATIRKFAREYAKEEYFNIDFTDANGNTVANYEYEGRINPERILNDVKYYFENGTTRESSSLMGFHDDVQYSERDTEYLELAKNPEKNEARLREMVEEAAKAAMPDSKVVDSNGKLKYVYHGTSNGGHTWFDTYGYYSKFGLFGEGTYFTENKDIAEQYTHKGRGQNPQIYTVFLNITNPIDMDAKADIDAWNEALQNSSDYFNLLEGEMTNEQAFRHMVTDLEDAMVYTYDAADTVRGVIERMGYDGITHIGGGRVGMSDGTRHRVWIAFESEQIKSADSVTYDDDKNIIPLSERFNFKEIDIRYSERRQAPTAHEVMGELKTLENRYKKLAADFANYKERVKLDKTLTKGKVIDPKQLEAVARYLVKFADSDYKASELAKMLNDLYVDIQDGAMDDSMSWDEMYSKAYEVAKEIRSEAKIKIERPALYDKILKDIRSARIAPNDGQKGDAKHRFGEHYIGKFRGRVTIANDGTPLDIKWSEWAAEYPSVFDKDIGDAQQLVELYDIYDDLRNAGDVVQEYEESEMLQSLTTEIINKAWTVTKFESTADKQNKRIQELNAEHRKAMEELKDTYAKKVSDAKLLEQMYYGKLLNQVQTKRKQEVSEAKAAGRERLAQYKENAERKSVIQTITGDCLRLNKMLVTNSKDLHIHEALKGPVMELLTAIDFSSKRMLDKGIPTQKDISLGAALTKVKDMMKDASDGNLNLVHLYGHNLDEDIKKMMESVTTIRRSFADNEFVLQQMSLDDLVTLKKIVKTIKSAVNKLNEFHIVQHAKGIAHLSQESIEYLDSLGRGKIFDGIRGNLDKTMVWNNTLPYYAFKRYGEGGTLVYEALMDGWDMFAFNIDKIMRFTQSVYTDKEVDAWDAEVKTFKIAVPATEAQLADPDFKPKFQEVQMTVSQIMSLYCLQKREQAHKHLLEGGIRVDNFKKKNGEIVTQEDGAVLTAKDIETIISSLSVRQRAVADKLQEFLNTVCSDWGNEVSMARFGIRQFGEVYYFPIKSDDDNVTQDEPKEEADSFFKILGASFAKGLTEGANNRIVISNIFDVFAKHTSDMAKYNALALPVLDAFRWYNYKGKEAVGDEGAFISYSLKQSMKKAFGDDGLKYFTQFLKDINGTKTVSRDTLGDGFIRNDKIASVGANLRVVFLQPTSYVRASAVIDNKYLTKALTFKDKARGKAADMAEKYCGIALWKSLGYYDINVQQGVTDQIKHKSNWHDRATDLSMKGASMADRLTWGLLWNACELEIRDTRKDLKVGSEEFYKAIGKRLREVIYATQVVDSTMTRSQMMRSGDKRDKLATSFMSEPTLSYNMVLDAVMDIKLESRRNGSKNAWKKYGWKVARTAYAYTMTNALAALIETAFDAYRDDDDEEKDLLDYVKRYFANFAGDMSIVGKIPILKDALSIIQGYGASYSVLAGFEGLYMAVTQWWKIFTTDKGNPATALKNTLKALSSISGLPFYNVYRDVSAGLDKFFGVEIKELLNDLVD